MIVERRFRSEESMNNYINNKWMVKQLKKKYDPTIYTAVVDHASMELRISERK